MIKVLLAIHLLVALALVAVVLLQRSEGGALGIGGGGGFMSGRGAANLLTRATAVLAAVFFATSIILTVLARHGTTPSLFEGVSGPGQAPAPAQGGAPAPGAEAGKPADGAATQPAREAPASPPAPGAPSPK